MPTSNDDPMFDWRVQELRKDKEKQKKVFWEILCRLEGTGMCRYVFHSLAAVLVDDEDFLGE